MSQAYYDADGGFRASQFGKRHGGDHSRLELTLMYGTTHLGTAYSGTTAFVAARDSVTDARRSWARPRTAPR
ncbi:MAG: hypothetical protein JWR24_1816 [Actinoallomurus sp.]|nr:hypothetical protein [Actinoallomurus sp.]